MICKRITIAQYPATSIEERYYPVRQIGNNRCLICIHYTARCDLRQNKRHIVPLEKGQCRLNKTLSLCNSYERIFELRAKNMNILEKVYFSIYTKKYLNKVLRWHINNPKLIFNKKYFGANTMANLISTYEQQSKAILHK